MKFLVSAIALSLMTTSAVYASPGKCQENQKCDNSASVIVKKKQEEIRRIQRDRVYRGSGVRPERRCFEVRTFDYVEGIVTSRYECR